MPRQKVGRALLGVALGNTKSAASCRKLILDFHGRFTHLRSAGNVPAAVVLDQDAGSIANDNS